MAQIDLDVSYTMRLTSAEFRLVTLALAGKIRSKEETRAALLLNKRLCELRARFAEQLHDVATGALTKATELSTSALVCPGSDREMQG